MKPKKGIKGYRLLGKKKQKIKVNNSDNSEKEVKKKTIDHCTGYSVKEAKRRQIILVK